MLNVQIAVCMPFRKREEEWSQRFTEFIDRNNSISLLMKKEERVADTESAYDAVLGGQTLHRNRILDSTLVDLGLQ